MSNKMEKFYNIENLRKYLRKQGLCRFDLLVAFNFEVMDFMRDTPTCQGYSVYMHNARQEDDLPGATDIDVSIYPFQGELYWKFLGDPLGEINEQFIQNNI